MCCCDCLLVHALIDAARIDASRKIDISQTGPAIASPSLPVSRDLLPKRSCGSNLLTRLHRRWHAHFSGTSAS